MIIKNILQKNKLLLKKHNITNFNLDAEILLCFVLFREREYLITHGEKKISLFSTIVYSYLINKRIKGFSVATIIKQKSFYGREFMVNRHVLIPRPETEIMIDEVLKKITQEKSKYSIIDIGTGSGCIPITISKEITNSNNLFLAVDISRKALKIAYKNSILHNVSKKITFFRGNLLTPILKKINTLKLSKNPIILTANLPYLTDEQIKNSPSIQKEPITALNGGDNGLYYYKKLFKQISELDRKTNSPICLFSEIDPSQSRSFKELQVKELPKYTTRIKNDLAGKARLAITSIYKSTND
jgi:release factor glutamine methyltransferase